MKTKLGLIALMVILPFYLFADPAKKVTLSYNKETHKLSLIIDHPVTNAKEHFIDIITILVDGKEVKVIKPNKQTSLKTEMLDVEIPEIKTSSKIEVKTHCNEGGNKTGKLTVK